MDITLLPIAAFICDNNGYLLQTNKLFDQLVGDGTDHHNVFNHFSPATRLRLFNAIKILFSYHNTKVEAELISNIGQILHTEVSLSPLPGGRILALVYDITKFKRREEQLLNTIIASEEKERKRIATELHDNLSPILSAIKLYISLIKKKIDGQDQNVVKDLETLTEEAIKTAKEISYNLTPGILHDFGLAAAIIKFVQFVNNTRSLNITVKTDKYTLTRRYMAESILYHTVKELINNTIKHSKATEALIDLRSTDKTIVLYYRDNGQGFDLNEKLNNHTGLGLRNMINKITSFNGTIEILTNKGKGMIAIITMPVQISKTQENELHNSYYSR